MAKQDDILARSPSASECPWPPESIRAQVVRILRSQPFSNAPMLSRLLDYLVERSLDGSADRLKEYSLGFEVFDRGESFDPRTDTIVRVQARTLRRKLKEYYDVEGRVDPIVIELPKGHYVAVFRSAAARSGASTQNLEALNLTTVPRPLPLSAPRTSLPPPDREYASRFRRPSGRLLFLASVAILAASITLILTRGSWPTGRQEKPTFFPSIESLAVLPLMNLSDDPEQMYFVDGMTDALISHLGRIGALRVISSTSAMQYRGTSKTLREIAKELDVQAVVEGSVLRSSNRVRITMRLIEAGTNRRLWEQSYEGDMQDVLALQSRVAGDVAGEIKIAVAGQQGISVVSRKLVNPEAYDAYLKGHYHLRKRTKEGFRYAVEFFERAIERDPNYASAYAGLADVYDLLAGYALLPPREAYPKARAAAIKALNIDDQLAEAHTALAKVKARYDWDWQGAEREFLRAIELNPGYAPGHHWYGYFYLAALGRYDQAIEELEQAKRLDPLSFNINTELGLILSWAGKHERAIEQLQNTLEIDPDFSWTHAVLGRTYFNKGMFEAAIKEFQKAAKLSEGKLNTLYVSTLGLAYGASGREQEARKVLGTLIELKQKQYVPSDSIAEVYTGLGERAQALRWLEKAYQERSRRLSHLKVDPNWNSLRDDPKFQDLIRRIGLNH